MKFNKLSIDEKDDWILLFSLIPIILGILVFLALMIFTKFDLIGFNR